MAECVIYRDSVYHPGRCFDCHHKREGHANVSQNSEGVRTVYSGKATGGLVNQPFTSLPSASAPAPVDPLVHHPDHYTYGGIETIDFIEAKELTYFLGQVVKYVSRAGKKNAATQVQDLEKAAFYLEREIRRLKRAGAATTR